MQYWWIYLAFMQLIKGEDVLYNYLVHSQMHMKLCVSTVCWAAYLRLQQQYSKVRSGFVSQRASNVADRSHWNDHVIPQPWWRHQMETFFALLAICARYSPVAGEFPAQRPVTHSFDVFFICVWINGWLNNRKTGDLRRYRAHYDVTVMTKVR